MLFCCGKEDRAIVFFFSKRGCGMVFLGLELGFSKGSWMDT